MLGQRIKELRINNNVSQKTLAEAIGITQQGLSKIENNKSEPHLETKKKIVEYFGIEFLYLATKDEIEIYTNFLKKVFSDALDEKIKRDYQSR